MVNPAHDPAHPRVRDHPAKPVSILQPGDLVGKYPVTRLLSAGGMGMLYEAVHPILGTRVAIKTIRPELAHDKVVVERFLKEALSACRVRDDRLPAIQDHDFLPDGSPYMVMELLEGEDLAQRLGSGPLEPSLAARVLVEVLEVLAKVHRLGIIHRDIKPQNIFLARSDLWGEVPKLLDFGVAHIASDTLTRPGEVMGTPLYMALEQAQGSGRVGPWTDVFSAGVVLYECLAGLGQRPWGALTPLAYVTRLSTGVAPRPLEDAAPGTPPGLCALVMRAIAVQPEARFPDAATFAQALEPFARPRTFGPRPLGEATPPGTQPPSPVAETAWGRPADQSPVPTRRGRRTSPGTEAVSRLRDKLAQMGRGRDETTGRLRPGERHPVVVLALSFELAAGLEVGLQTEEVDELLADLTRSFDRELVAAGGRVEQPQGRALLATFGHERVAEDDAERAALAALRLIDHRREVEAALADIGCGLHLRIGLHHGFVVRSQPAELTGGSPTTGDTVNVARFLEELAPLNGIYASRAVCDVAGERFAWRLVGSRDVRGRAEPIEVHELMGLEAAPSARRHRRTPFVGRATQLAELMRIAQEGGAIGLVVGPPGHGKTRLLHEALRRLETLLPAPRVVVAEPVPELPYGLWSAVITAIIGENTLPSVALRALAPELERHAELVALLLGDEPETDRLVAPDVLRGRIHQLIIDLVAVAGRGGRLVLVLDSLHRADEASLEILVELAGRLTSTPQAPVLLMAARAGEVPRLPASVPVCEVALGRLTDGEVEAMIDCLGPDFSPAARGLLRERAAGIPLFLEELAASLQEDQLASANTLILAGFRVPESLYGMLLARLTRLPMRLREVVRHLSVFGLAIRPELWTRVSDALAQLDEQTRPGLRTTALDELSALVDAGVLEGRVADEQHELVFRQSLLREAVYATVLPENRRLLHRLIAEALEALPADHARLGPQLLLHYHQAGAIERTVFYARRVGRRALRLGAWSEAVQALLLAVSLQGRLDEGPTEHAATLLDLAWNLLYLGRFGEAADRARDATALATSPDQVGQGHLVCAQVAWLRGTWEEAREELEMAEHLFEEAGQEVQAARARSAQGFVLRSMGRPAEGLPLAASGWTTLKRSGDRDALLRSAHDLGNVLRDLKRPEAALQVIEEALEVAAPLEEARHTTLGPGEAWVEPAVRSARAILCAELGRFDEAIALQTSVYEEGRRQGNKVTQALTSFHLAHHLAAAGRSLEAEHMASTALDLAGEVGMADRAVRTRMLLADLATRRGDGPRRLEHLSAAEFLARTAVPQQNGAADALWLRVAKVLLPALTGRDGELAALRKEANRRARTTFDAALKAELEALG